MVDEWNRFSNHVSAQSLENFKKGLDKFMDDEDKWKLEAVFCIGVFTYGFPIVSLICFFSKF